MSAAEYFSLVSAQRACRSFTPDYVPDPDVQRILEAATYAPSAQNSQPWVFVVVRDQATISRLSELTRRVWSHGARESVSGELDPKILREVDRYVDSGLGGAPLLIVVGADTNLVPASTAGSSVFPAVQNLLLAANALGYGSALTSLTVHLADQVRAALGMPGHVDPLAVVPIGRSARRLAPPRRSPVSDKAHRERFGTPWHPR